MKRLIFPIFFIILLASFAKPIQAQNFDSVEIKTIKINDRIYMLQGEGGNIGVLTGNDGIVIIDDQFAPLSGKIKAALKAISDKPVRFIINTHYHFDHTDGNENFGGEGAIIVSQENTRQRMTSDQFLSVFKYTQKASSYDALPKITFSDSVTLHLNNETLRVIHVKNAHTDGDAIIYFQESNVIHTGDVFVRYGLPFIDQEHGGSIDGMIKGTNAILNLSNEGTKIIPGHGELAVKKDVADYGKMLQVVRNKIADGIKKEKSLKQIIDENLFTEYKADFDRSAFIMTVYDSLKK